MKTLFLILAICAGAYLEHSDADDAAIQYCEMISIWKSTHGAAGWPPYRGRCEVAHAD